LPELALKFLKYSWLKLLVVVRHLSFGVTQWTSVENQVLALCGCLLVPGVSGVG
jgi:hypothetical protein